jgi:hypothetical protein
MIATQTDDNKTVLIDDTEILKKQFGKRMFDLVQLAMRSGLTEFSIPTDDNDQVRLDWKTRVWLMHDKGQPKFFLVAAPDNSHIEIIGPEIDPPHRRVEVAAASGKGKDEK